MDRICWIDVAAHRARVEAGLTWRALQDRLDPLHLAVKTMQSYSNFSVDGSRRPCVRCSLALTHGGHYYLPYQLHASQAQFERAYPEIERLRALKRKVDPGRRFSNALWDKHL